MRISIHNIFVSVPLAFLELTASVIQQALSRPFSQRVSWFAVAILFVLQAAVLSNAAAAADLSAYGIPTPPPITVFFESDRHLDGDGIHFREQVCDPLDYTIIGAVQATPGMLRQLFIGGYKSNNPVHKYANFGELAAAAQSQSTDKKVVVFVHGCCTNFPLATAQAASLAEYTGATVLMYDWGSPLISYGGSLLTYPRSQERFNRFMLDVAKAFIDQRVSVVGFSMGNQLLDNFLLQYKPSDVGRQFDQIIFSRADMDAIAFRTHMARVTAHAKHTFIYSSNNDSQLIISDALRAVASPSQHGKRLGDTRSNVRSEDTLTVLDVSPLKMNHSIPYEVIAEFLASDGEIPRSATHEYATLEDGVLKVSDKHSP